MVDIINNYCVKLNAIPLNDYSVYEIHTKARKEKSFPLVGDNEQWTKHKLQTL